MKRVIIYYLFAIFIFASSSVPLAAQSLPIVNTMHITIPLSDTFSYRYEKYLHFSYNQLGYKIIFEKILMARAIEMVDTGRLDAMMIAGKDVEQNYTNILRVPVMLARGTLVLYCSKQANCQASELNNANNIIGVIRGASVSGNFMRNMRASTYSVKSEEHLGSMLRKGRLNYILIINEEQFGQVGDLDDTQFQKVEVYHSEGYHYIHKKHKHLLPELTQALQIAIEKFGPLVEPDKTENN